MDPNMEEIRAAAERGKKKQSQAREELEKLLPGVIERESLALGTPAIFGPDGKCISTNWYDALRVFNGKAEKTARATRYLKEQAAEVMYEALQQVKAHLYNPFEPDNQSLTYARVCAALNKADGK